MYIYLHIYIYIKQFTCNPFVLLKPTLRKYSCRTTSGQSTKELLYITIYRYQQVVLDCSFCWSSFVYTHVYIHNPVWTVYLCFLMTSSFFVLQYTACFHLEEEMLQFHTNSDSSSFFTFFKHVLLFFLSFFAAVSKYALCKVIHQQSNLRLQVVFTSRLVCGS